MRECTTLKLKTYNYLTDNNDENKKAEGAKKRVIKQKIKFEDYEHCLKSTEL